MRTRTSRVQFIRSDRGASAVEYGLILAAIAALIVVAVFAFGGIVRNSLNSSTDCLRDASTGQGFATCPTNP